MPSATRARPICASRWCGSTSTSTASRSRGGEAGETRRVELHLDSRAHRHAPPGHRAHQSHLGHRRLRLDHHGRADHRRRAALLPGHALLRRPDDGRRGLQPGAVLAALVRRQLQHHRRLARDPAARRELPPRAHARPSRSARREPHRVRRGRARRDRGSKTSRSSRSSGRDALDERSVRLRPASDLLIVAEPGTGQDAAVPRAGGPVALGQRPHHCGRPGEQIFYLPRGTPYLPRGTLREVLAYPGTRRGLRPSPPIRSRCAASVSSASCRCSIETHRWDRELSQDEQLSLAFARIVLQRPPWLIVDDTFGSLDGETLERVVDIFARELRPHRRHPHRHRRGARSAVLAGGAPGQDTHPAPRPRRRSRRCWPWLAVLLAPLLAAAHAGRRQEFQFRPPTLARRRRDHAADARPGGARAARLLRFGSHPLSHQSVGAAAGRGRLRGGECDPANPARPAQGHHHAATDRAIGGVRHLRAHRGLERAESHPLRTAFKQSFTQWSRISTIAAITRSPRGSRRRCRCSGRRCSESSAACAARARSRCPRPCSWCGPTSRIRRT